MAYIILNFFIVNICICKRKGYISKLLKRDIFQRFATISFEFYMVHELILILFRKIFSNIDVYWVIKSIIIAIPAFIISIYIAKLTKLMLLACKKEMSTVK